MGSFFILRSSLFVSRESYFCGKCLIYPSNKYNNNCFFNLYGEYCPPKLGWYVELKNISWYRLKNSYYCIKIKLIPSKLFKWLKLRLEMLLINESGQRFQDKNMCFLIFGMTLVSFYPPEYKKTPEIF